MTHFRPVTAARPFPQDWHVLRKISEGREEQGRSCDRRRFHDCGAGLRSSEPGGGPEEGPGRRSERQRHVHRQERGRAVVVSEPHVFGQEAPGTQKGVGGFPEIPSEDRRGRLSVRQAFGGLLQDVRYAGHAFRGLQFRVFRSDRRSQSGPFDRYYEEHQALGRAGSSPCDHAEGKGLPAGGGQPHLFPTAWDVSRSRPGSASRRGIRRRPTRKCSETPWWSLPRPTTGSWP